MSEEATTETTEQTEASTQEAQTTETTTTQEATTEVSNTAILESLRGKVPAEQAKWLEKYKDDDGVIKGILSAQEMIGKKGEIPDENATPEQKAEFAKKIGADSLVFDKDKETIEFDPKYGEKGKEYSQAYGELVSEFMSNLSTKFGEKPTLATIKEAVLDFVKADAEKVWQNEQAMTETFNKQMTDVSAKYGLSVDQVKTANTEVMARFGFTNETPIVEILHTLAKETSGSTTMKGSTVPNSPAGVTNRLSAIMQDKNFWDRTTENAQQHDALVKEYQELSLKKVDSTM